MSPAKCWITYELPTAELGAEPGCLGRFRHAPHDPDTSDYELQAHEPHTRGWLGSPDVNHSQPY